MRKHCAFGNACRAASILQERNIIMGKLRADHWQLRAFFKYVFHRVRAG